MKSILFVAFLAMGLPSAAQADVCKTNARGETICVGNRVLNLTDDAYKYDVGTVTHIYPNGGARVILDGRRNPRPRGRRDGFMIHVNRLSPSVRCFRQTCVDQEVLDISDQLADTGVVRAVFAIGMTKVKLEGKVNANDVNGFYNRRFDALARSVQCLERFVTERGRTYLQRFCVNDRVFDKSAGRMHTPGTVRKVFTNGLLKVALDNHRNLASRDGLFNRTFEQVTKTPQVIRPVPRPMPPQPRQPLPPRRP